MKRITLNEITEPVKEDLLSVISKENLENLPASGVSTKTFAEKYGVNPFDDSLCAACQELGYCRLKREKKESIFLQDHYISNLVPIGVDGEYQSHMGAYSRKHLKAGFESFHQQDYESAIINCKAVIEANTGLSIPYLVIAISHYFLGEYSEAISQYELYLNYLRHIPMGEEDKMHHFIWHCENKLRKLTNSSTE